MKFNSITTFLFLLLTLTHAQYDNALNLKVAISKEYLEIWARGGSMPRIFFNEDTRQLSAYDELAEKLTIIHSRFTDSPDANNIIILVDEDTASEKINNVIDIARKAGFSKITTTEIKEMLVQNAEKLKKQAELQQREATRKAARKQNEE